jgi:hypothetical protein
LTNALQLASLATPVEVIELVSRYVVEQFDREAGPTRNSGVAKSATRRAARPDPSPRKKRLLGMTIKLHRYL